jgi:hypothetical protein
MSDERGLYIWAKEGLGLGNAKDRELHIYYLDKGKNRMIKALIIFISGMVEYGFTRFRLLMVSAIRHQFICNMLSVISSTIIFRHSH